MASPFNVFRRNQRIWMAVLVGLSMFAFIVAGTINATNAPVFLGAILGAIGLWLLSNKGGNEGWLIAAVGGVIGAIIGAFAPGWLGRDTVVYTNEGNLTQQEITEILEDQQLANQFVQMAFGHVFESTPEDERFGLQRPLPFQYVQVADAASAQENAVFTYLFGKKADEMGITLTDEAVQQFIVNATNGELTPEAFREIQNQLQVGPGELTEVLREQMRAREAYRLLSPVGSTSLGPSTPTPQELWNNFKKLKAEATVAVATLPVEEFVSEVEDPATEELRRFFEQYKAQAPMADGTPGFRVPRKVRTAYLEILASGVREGITPPTEAEVLAHYEANKARYEFSQQMPEGHGAEIAPATREPIEAPRPGADAGASGASPVDDPAAEAASPSPGEASAAPVAAPMPAPEEEPLPEAEGDAASSPAEAAKPETAPPGESDAGIARDGMAFVSFQAEAPKPADAVVPASDEPEPASDAASTPEKEMPAEETSEETATPPGPTLPEIPATDPAAAEGGSSTEEQPASGEESQADAGPSEQTLAMIRQELISQRVREALNARQLELREQVDVILQDVMSKVPLPTNPQDAEQIAEHEAARTVAIKQVLKRLEALAEKNENVEYRFTPEMSFEELMTSEDYPVGQSMRWRENQPMFGGDNTPVAQMLFQSAPDQPLLPINAQSYMNESRYVVLKVADMPTRIPEFGEDGVEEQVTEAWKLIEARKLAEERARELVKTVNESESSLEELAKEKTVTGETPGEDLTVEEVGPFSWLQRSSVPSQGMSMPEIQRTPLPSLPAAGEEFMRTVFETTGVGKAGAAPSVDGENYYVVQVKSRTPEKELETARQEFLAQDFFTDQMNPFTGQSMNPYRRATLNEALAVRQSWMRNFLEQHEFVTSAGTAP